MISNRSDGTTYQLMFNRDIKENVVKTAVDLKKRKRGLLGQYKAKAMQAANVKEIANRRQIRA
jgi:hypothetical protein